MIKVLAIVLLAAAATQAKFIPEMQDAIVRYPEVLKRYGLGVPSSGRIIGGSPATSGQFPYQCRLSIATASGNFFCGCSIISETHILTAAHCTEGATRVTVTWDTLSSSTGGSSVSVLPASIKLHENWNSNTLSNDVSIITVPAITLGGGVAAICLDDTNAESALVGQVMRVSGWGKTSDVGSVSAALNWVDVDGISNAVCRSTYGAIILASTLCTQTSGKGTCSGDSGGPLVYPPGNGAQQVGVVSFVSSAGCVEGPAGFARVHSFAAWIRANSVGSC